MNQLIVFFVMLFIVIYSNAQEKWPDVSPISDWFYQDEEVELASLGKQYVITDYGMVNDETIL